MKKMNFCYSLDSIVCRCERCRGRLKVWPKKLGAPFTCDNFGCDNPSLGSKSARFNCFPCDYDLCKDCATNQPQRGDKKKGKSRQILLRDLGESYQNDKMDDPQGGLNNSRKQLQMPPQSKLPTVLINDNSSEQYHALSYHDYQNPLDNPHHRQQQVFAQLGFQSSVAITEKQLNPHDMNRLTTDLRRSCENLLVRPHERGEELRAMHSSSPSTAAVVRSCSDMRMQDRVRFDREIPLQFV